jgi:hypothetical protein
MITSSKQPIHKPAITGLSDRLAEIRRAAADVPAFGPRASALIPLHEEDRLTAAAAGAATTAAGGTVTPVRGRRSVQGQAHS